MTGFSRKCDQKSLPAESSSVDYMEWTDRFHAVPTTQTCTVYPNHITNGIFPHTMELFCSFFEHLRHLSVTRPEWMEHQLWTVTIRGCKNPPTKSLCHAKGETCTAMLRHRSQAAQQCPTQWIWGAESKWNKQNGAPHPARAFPRADKILSLPHTFSPHLQWLTYLSPFSLGTQWTCYASDIRRQTACELFCRNHLFGHSYPMIPRISEN